MTQESPEARHVTPRSMLAAVVAIALVCHVVAHVFIETFFGSLSQVTEILVEAGTSGGLGGVIVWFTVIRPWADGERRSTAEREERMRREGRRQDLDSRIHRALEMATTERGCYDVVELALERAVPRVRGELLLADSSDAHLKTALEVGPDGRGPGCTVPSPNECPAVRRAQTVVVGSSSEIDACPYLRGRPEGDCAAACIPVSVAGRSIGVLHTTAPEHTLPTGEEVTLLESIANQAGTRIGLLRVMAQTHLQAATDPLTGLLNRRSVESRASELIRRGVPLAVAMGDLDHFKALNDRHGHEAGDRALRLFARTLQQGLRGDDLVSRYGGEEFVVVFPERTAEEAAAALARLQEQLMVALAAGSVPGFTCSFGVADSSDASTLEEMLATADSALFQAKRDGRDRVVLAHQGAQEATAPAAS